MCAQVASIPPRQRSPSVGGRALWLEKDLSPRMRIPHTFQLHTYTRPTVCTYCKKMLRGLYKQGLKCKDCNYNAHKKCIEKIPKDCICEIPKELNEYPDSLTGSESNLNHTLAEDDSDDTDRPNRTDDCPELIPVHDEDSPDVSDDKSNPSNCTSSSSPSSNIPLMRIVQSVKHTKRRGSKVVKEGWLVHFTNKNRLVRRHYWRLDTKSITLFHDEQSSNYYKEIALSDIIAVDTARHKQGDYMHCFELRTTNIDYFVGQDPLYGLRESDSINLPHPDSGIGAYLAKSWETAIRQALLPVTSTARADESEDKLTDMSQVYEIFPDEVLGSGQFGVVYGGIHKRTQRAVAIKVIDKLRFPTKQEAQLKNEVAILQNLSHGGVVNLERMFETPERIFVVMEKLKGDMLEMILHHDKGRLSERVTKFLITQVYYVKYFTNRMYFKLIFAFRFLLL